MFDIGWPELLVVAVVLIIVVGPKDLPGMLRSFGRTSNKLRSMAGDFRRQFDDALKEAELGDVKDLVDSARKLDPRSEIRKHLDPLKSAADDIKADLNKAVKSVDAAPEVSPDEAEPAAKKPAGKSKAGTGAKAAPAKAVAGAKAAPAKAGAGKPKARAPKPKAAKKTVTESDA